MYSLFHSLLAQHPRQLTPLQCGLSTITQLQRYFEDVVLENNLSALVIESLTPVPERSAREIARLKELEQTSRGLFLMVSAEDGFAGPMLYRGKRTGKAIVWERTDQGKVGERFVVIADARFSALLASVHNQDETAHSASELVIWTFEPDVVYSALEYLMARVTAEQPLHAPVFEETVRQSMPKATSLQLTLGVTTKLARLLQEQAEREVAVNRIAMAIRNPSGLDSLLQTAAQEVGRALNAFCCAIRLEGDALTPQMTKCHFRDGRSGDEGLKSPALADLDDLRKQVAASAEIQVVDGDHCDHQLNSVHATVPLMFEGDFLGILLVRSDDRMRIWAENELLLLQTVSDQLGVAVNREHLLAQLQQQALTDALTGCYNRRSFEMQLEQQLHLATRMRQPLSLIILDLDNFKDINDGSGHETGDLALRMLADALRAELRGVDIAARYGGDEFVVVLPQANCEGALVVAERLRQRVEQTEVPGFGPITASFGLATFPVHASSRDTLIVAADRALYSSKFAGRNRVSTPPQEQKGTFPVEEYDEESLLDAIEQT